MTIDEAIEILQTDHTKPVSHTVLDFFDAVKLGVEALQEIQYQQGNPKFGSPKPLPSETKED